MGIMDLLNFGVVSDDDKDLIQRRGQFMSEGLTYKEADQAAREEASQQKFIEEAAVEGERILQQQQQDPAAFFGRDFSGGPVSPIPQEVRGEGSVSPLDLLGTGTGAVGGAVLGGRVGAGVGSLGGPIGTGIGGAAGTVLGGLIGGGLGGVAADAAQDQPLGTAAVGTVEGVGKGATTLDQIRQQRLAEQQAAKGTPFLTPEQARQQQLQQFQSVQPDLETIGSAIEVLKPTNLMRSSSPDSLLRIKSNRQHMEEALQDQNTQTGAVNALIQQAQELQGVRRGLLENILPQIQQNTRLAQQQQMEAAKQAELSSLGGALGSLLGGALGGNVGGGLQRAGASLAQGRAAGGAAAQQGFKQSLDVIKLMNDTSTRQGNILGKVASEARQAPKDRLDTEQSFLDLQLKQIEAERKGLVSGSNTMQIGGRTLKALPASGVSTPGIGSFGKPGTQQLFLPREAFDNQGKIDSGLRKEINQKSGFMNQTKVLMDEMLQIYEQVGPQFDPALSPTVSITDPLTGETRDVNAGARLGQIHSILTGESRIKFGGPLDEGMERVISKIVKDPGNITSALKALGTDELEAIKTQVREFGRQAVREFDIFKQSNNIQSELDLYIQSLEGSGFAPLANPVDGKKYALPTGDGNVMLLNDAELIKIMRLLRNQ